MSKSMPIAWHRERLTSLRQSANDAALEHQRAWERKRELENRCDLLLRQITEAERRGKTEFDAERYLVKRGKKTDV